MNQSSRWTKSVVVAGLLVLAACGSADPIGTDDASTDTASGTCVFWQDCDDGNPCTTKDCIEGKCVIKPRTGRACDDANICTSNDTCREDGQCAGEEGTTCDDKNICTVDSCDPNVGCKHDNNDKLPCEDGDGCTVGDGCQDGQCVGGEPKVCEEDPSPCRTSECDSETGECVPVWDAFVGDECDDGNPCTLEDSCDSHGICFGSKPKVCVTNLTCKQSTCNQEAAPGTDPCIVDWKDEGGSCDDLDVCTMLDQCLGDGEGMTCAGEPVECTSANSCETGSCVPGVGCVFEPTNQGAPCSGKPNYFCEGGQCICHPKCDGKVCGDDTCGGVCGLCPENSLCFLGGCLEPGLECVDGNEEPGDGCFEGKLTEFVIEPEGQAGGSAPDMVALASGGYWVAWRAFDGDLVQVRQFSADGWPQGETLTATTSVKGSVERPRVMALANGFLVVSWTDKNDDRDRVYFRILRSDGTWETGQTEVSSGTGDQRDIDAAPLQNGNFVVVWERRDPANGKHEIRMRQYIPQGDAVHDFVKVDTLNANAYGPRVAPMPGGGFVVVWEHLISEGGGEVPEGLYTSVYGWVMDLNGLTVGNMFNAWNGKILGPTNPDLLQVGEGFELFWNGNIFDPVGTWAVQGRSFGPMGTAWSGYFPVSDGAGEPCGSPASAVGFDQAWVAFERSQEVFVRRLTLEWALLGSSFNVATLTEGVQKQPDIEALTSGEFLVVWTTDLPGGGTTVVASRFTSSGERLYR